MIELVLVPAGIGRYVATLDGRAIVKPTRQPFFNAARALLAMGHDPATVLEARHRGSAIVAMRSAIGEAAKWTIKETDRGGLQKRRWEPVEIAVSPVTIGARTAAEASAGTSVPPDGVAVLEPYIGGARAA